MAGPIRSLGRSLGTTAWFGVVLYEMATGQLPFHAESSATIFDEILNRAPVPAGHLNADLPAKLEERKTRGIYGCSRWTVRRGNR